MATSKPYSLIRAFALVWEKCYRGKKYLPSPKDFKFAKMFLEYNGGEFVADEIVARAEVYMQTGSVYAENRHGFSAFINNIGSFVELPKEMEARIGDALKSDGQTCRPSPGTQAARITFQHGEKELANLRNLEESLIERDRQRSERAGSG